MPPVSSPMASRPRPRKAVRRLQRDEELGEHFDFTAVDALVDDDDATSSAIPSSNATRHSTLSVQVAQLSEPSKERKKAKDIEMFFSVKSVSKDVERVCKLCR